MKVSKEVFKIIKQRYLNNELKTDCNYEIKSSDESYKIEVVEPTVMISEFVKNKLVEYTVYYCGIVNNIIKYYGNKQISYGYSTIHEGRLLNTKYYKNEKLHRLDGPAIEYTNPTWENYYYISGHNISLAFFNKIRKNLKRGSLGNILERYSINELEIIKEFVLEMGSEIELDKVNKYILIKKLEGWKWKKNLI